jgi:hypothetical protein
MAPKVMFITGVSESTSIDWTAAALLDDFEPAFYELVGLAQAGESRQARLVLSSSPEKAVWRSIPLRRERLPTGLSQVHGMHSYFHTENDFFSMIAPPIADSYVSTDSRLSADAKRTLLDDFYDHSVALHDDIPSSQLPQPSLDADETSFQSEDITVQQGSADDSTSSILITDGGPVPGDPHLSDLEDLPNARYLEAIAPQTMTVNLIAGVISVAEPRKIKTRWGTEKSLVELLVGDETKAGFSITFWLSSSRLRARYGQDSTETTLRTLRRQDVVLLRNVALGSFQGKVHGHSLRKDLTRVDLLYRRKLDRNDAGGFYTAKQVNSRQAAHPQLEKTREVREWILMFVAGGTNLGKRKADDNALRSWDKPPEDTQ